MSKRQDLGMDVAVGKKYGYYPFLTFLQGYTLRNNNLNIESKML